MPCYSPLIGYQQTDTNANGKRPLRFSQSEAFKHNEILVPCGKCLGCQLEYARQWTVRCYHEAQMHEENSFLTLTYDEQNAPHDKSVHKSEVQKFLKRLRKLIQKNIKYFAAGEYGEKGWKPHYHILIFGYNFPDRTLWGLSPKGNKLYVSETLGRAWKKGYHSIGDLTVQSASYTAQYCMKKLDLITNEDGTIPLLDKETGEIITLNPEFTLKSTRDPLGTKWFNKYWRDVYPKDFVTINGTKHKPPKYYDTLLEALQPAMAQQVKDQRMAHAKIQKQKGETKIARQREKEIVKQAQVSTFERPLED